MNGQQQQTADGRQVPGGMDLFDYQMGQLDGLTGGLKTKPATMRTVVGFIGAVQTFTVQTIRTPELGDHVFIEFTSATGFQRIVLPPQVADAIARQRDSLTATGRSRRGKEAAAARKASGAPNPLNDPAVRAKAAAARQRKAAAKRRKAKR